MYTIESRIRYSECDENATLSLLGLLNYLQDCSTFHSEDLFRGVSDMGARGLAWLIAAWQIKIDRLPRFCEHITVDTWLPSMGRTLANRNFVMRDAAGTPLVKADSLWFVFDANVGRPVRIPEDQTVYLTGEKPLDLPPTKRRLPLEGTFNLAPTLTVVEQHLDTNRHVNNAQYLGMAVDALGAAYGPDDVRSSDAIDTISIQYKRQAHLGDLIMPRVQATGHHRTVDLATDDGDSYAVVRIKLKG